MGASTTSTNGRVRRTASEWQVLVKRYAEGGGSQAAFCRAEGISASTFALWQRKLGLQARGTDSHQATATPPGRRDKPPRR